MLKRLAIYKRGQEADNDQKRTAVAADGLCQ